MSIIKIYLGKDCDEVDWLKFFHRQRTKELIMTFQFYSTLPSSIQDLQILKGNIKLVTQTLPPSLLML